MRAAPGVSVVLPAHDVERFVEQALRSALAQTYPELEVIAVDDGSADATGAILERLAAESPRLRVVRQPRAGVAAARNTGLRQSQRPYVAFLDADDRWQPALLERLVARLEASPELDLAFPRYRYIGADGEPIGVESRPARARYGFEELAIDNPIHSATGVVARRGALLAAGGFDESLASTVDLDLWLRVALQRPQSLGCVPELLADYRRREGQITGDWRRMQQGWERVIAKLARDFPERLAPIEREARARHHVYWSALAYERGEYREARRQIARAWRLAPAALVADSRAWVRSAAAATSLLPAAAHRRIGRAFNRLRQRLGIQLT